MRRWIVAAILAGLPCACGTLDGTVRTDPARTVLGVVVHQPAPGEDAAAAADPASAEALQWKVNQLCTRGDEPLRQDIEPAENDKQLVDWQLRCNEYELTAFGHSFANLWPSPSSLWPF